jgi:hypothetical protein
MAKVDADGYEAITYSLEVDYAIVPLGGRKLLVADLTALDEANEPKQSRKSRGPDKAPRRRRGKMTVPTDGEEPDPFSPVGTE